MLAMFVLVCFFLKREEIYKAHYKAYVYGICIRIQHLILLPSTKKLFLNFSEAKSWSSKHMHGKSWEIYHNLGS